jgi:hypothetical protein
MENAKQDDKTWNGESQNKFGTEIEEFKKIKPKKQVN